MKHIGIVGVGGFAATVLRSILAVEQDGLAHLDAAVIRNPAKYADTLEKLRQQGRTIYTTVSEMLEKERGRVDIVALPVGIPYHSELAIQALEAGYDVLLEKPVAATVQEVDAIIAAEKRTGHFVAIGYQHIQTPAIQALRQALKADGWGISSAPNVMPSGRVHSPIIPATTGPGRSRSTGVGCSTAR